jgi:hypothetical protein
VTRAAQPARHPTARDWRFPDPARAPLGAPLERTNLRELEARPLRFEHHLMVVARVGDAQLEVATASEPLYFAHLNISDEYAIAMQTGSELVDAVRFRTFLSDQSSLEDVARLHAGTRDFVLHPFGLLHWPGRLRPPFVPFDFPPGTRQCGFSLVYCASLPTPPGARPAFVSAGRERDAKLYGERAAPLLIADTRREPARTLGVVGETRLDLLVSPERVAPARGGYVLVLDTRDGSAHFACDLIYVPPGAELSAGGVERALLLWSETQPAEAPPASWRETPAAPFAPFEQGPRVPLPLTIGDLGLEATSPSEVSVRIAQSVACVPRYWLVRFLFRVALHQYRLGYVETYGGFFYDDRDGEFQLGVRGAGAVHFSRAEIATAVERIYRAVAPGGYVERIA